MTARRKLPSPGPSVRAAGPTLEMGASKSDCELDERAKHRLASGLEFDRVEVLRDADPQSNKARARPVIRCRDDTTRKDAEGELGVLRGARHRSDVVKRGREREHASS